MKKTNLFKNCKRCGSKFRVIPSSTKRRMFCSRSCAAKGRKSVLGKRWKLSEEAKQNMSKPKGAMSLSWKGGIRRMRGYVLRYTPEHPFKSKQGYVMEHRLVMEKKLGRYLNPDEIVHHKNGKKNDNRPKNLELTTYHDHFKFHSAEWASHIKGVNRWKK